MKPFFKVGLVAAGCLAGPAAGWPGRVGYPRLSQDFVDHVRTGLAGLICLYPFRRSHQRKVTFFGRSSRGENQIRGSSR